MLDPKQVNPQAPETRNVAISAELHRQLKVFAARQGLSLKKLVEQAIIDSIGETHLSQLTLAVNVRTPPKTG